MLLRIQLLHMPMKLNCSKVEHYGCQHFVRHTIETRKYAFNGTRGYYKILNNYYMY